VTERPAAIRVILADDHPLYLQALVAVVEHAPELELCATAADGREALGLILEHRPDVAVLDYQMGAFDGPRVARHVGRADAPTRMLVLSARDDGHLVHQAMSAGAHGYLSKDADPQEIRAAIGRIAAGEVVLGSGASAALASELRAGAGADTPMLSERESEVLALVAEGRSVAEIGAQLHLSPATVKTHLQTLYGKLGVSERAAAVAAAMRRDLLH
jgi:two-component system nitrate/nitrite response regulator NarL